jgi:hypothetical protein
MESFQKRLYPLNIAPKSPTRYTDIKKKIQRIEDVPLFIKEFVSEQYSPKLMPTSKINTRSSFPSSCLNTCYLEKNYSRDLHPPIRLEIPPISYKAIKDSKNTFNRPKTKKNNLVRFYNKSKVFISKKRSTSGNFCGKTSLKDKKKILEPELIRSVLQKNTIKIPENLKFNEKLKKLKEIIKDPLIYEL